MPMPSKIIRKRFSLWATFKWEELIEKNFKINLKPLYFTIYREIHDKPDIVATRIGSNNIQLILMLNDWQMVL